MSLGLGNVIDDDLKIRLPVYQLNPNRQLALKE